MRKTLQKAGYSTLLATLMLAASAQAENPPATLSDIAKQLEAINNRLEQIERDMKFPDGATLALKTLQDEMTKMKRQIAALEQKAPYVAKRVDTSKAIDPSPRPAASNLGKVRFINDWIEDVSVMVNGQSYEVMIGSELTVPVPAGQFNYQVLNLQRRAMTRTVEADKTWEVRINTRN